MGDLAFRRNTPVGKRRSVVYRNYGYAHALLLRDVWLS